MNLKWYLNRLQAMSMQEIRWRLEQKKIAKAEEKVFGNQKIAVTDGIFYPDMADLEFHPERMVLPAALKPAKPSGKIPLLCGYAYETYKKSWHAGFQTENEWPLVYSAHLNYKQMDKIGDARTNWELNRYMQFAALGYQYREAGEEKALLELMDLFSDWNMKNPYLWGISWTSAMEIAIRAVNWMYTLYFVKGKASEDLCELLQNGIINMITYLCAHYSRFSSANNHVIVEAVAIGIAGLAFACEDWTILAMSILQEEIPRQNFKDGMNREMSLHYHAFFMEAVGIFAILLRHNKRNVPMKWRYTLMAMTAYLQDCIGSYGEVMVFGDDDEGRIMNLSGEPNPYYRYVLSLMEEWLPTKNPLCEGESFSTEKLICNCYPEGGMSLIHSKDGILFAGIDHGPLGFGAIAAHGHADALSFQLFLEGKRIFADPGTGLYHVDLARRNWIRSTRMHNTVTINGKDQSEMLGAFLWGKKANGQLLNCGIGDDNCVLIATQQEGYSPVLHCRDFLWKTENRCKIIDELLGVKQPTTFELNFLLEPGNHPVETALGRYEIRTENGYLISMTITGGGMFTSTIVDSKIAKGYGVYEDTKQIRISGKTQNVLKMTTDIRWEKL